MVGEASFQGVLDHCNADLLKLAIVDVEFGPLVEMGIRGGNRVFRFVKDNNIDITKKIVVAWQNKCGFWSVLGDVVCLMCDLSRAVEC